MADMQQIEASVGKNNFLTRNTPLCGALHERFLGANLVPLARLSVRREPRDQFVFGNRNRSQFPHHDPCSHIGEADSFVKREAGSNSGARCRDERIARTGYVEDLASQCWKALYRARLNQCDSQLTESHNQTLYPKVVAELLAFLQQQIKVAMVRGSCCYKFHPVRGNRVASSVFLVVQAFGVDKRGYG